MKLYRMDRISERFYQTILPLSLQTASTLFRVNKMSQKETSKEILKDTKIQENLFCLLEYNPINLQIKEWIGELWPILNRSSGTIRLIHVDLICDLRYPKSLQDILVHTNIYGGNSNCRKPQM